MSEQKAGYSAGPMISLQDLAAQPCCLPFAHPDYRPPTPGEVDALIKAAGWSQNEAAKIVGVSFDANKGSITIRRWRAPLTSDHYREIPYSAWRLMLINAGAVSEGPMVAGQALH